MAERLEWGETPWDKKTREELLLDVKRMYGAIVALNSVCSLCKCGQEVSSFWSNEEGSGFRALELARQILEPIHKEYDSEDIYRSFFRYAYDLLFDGKMGFGWYVCDTCKRMIGRSQDKETREGDWCMFPPCQGKYRKLTWQDMKPSIQPLL